jgi:hypothetical protein
MVLSNFREVGISVQQFFTCLLVQSTLVTRFAGLHATFPLFALIFRSNIFRVRLST